MTDNRERLPRVELPAPFQAGAYTVIMPGGSRVASACTNDWMPP